MLLSGGGLYVDLAHDFNNLLGIMLNFTAFAVENADDPASVRSDLATDLNENDAAYTPEFGISVIEKPFTGCVLLTEIGNVLNATSRP